LQNLQIGSGVAASLGLLTIFAPGLLKLPQDIKPKTRNKSSNIEERLAKIQDMKEKGLISEAEYENLRRKALEEM